MRKEILEALKAKFPGVSEEILGRIADKLAKTATTAELVQTAVDGVDFQQVLESYGDRRATEAQQTAISNYEKKHGLKDGKKTEEKKPEEKKKEEKPEENVPSWAQQLIDANKSLQEKISAMEGEKLVNNRKTTLNGILKSAPETIRQRYEKDFARMTFKDDDDFNAWIGEITPDVEKLTSDLSAKGGVVGRPKSGGDDSKKDEKNPYLEARLKEREAATTTTAIQGLSNETLKK